MESDTSYIEKLSLYHDNDGQITEFNEVPFTLSDMMDDHTSAPTPSVSASTISVNTPIDAVDLETNGSDAESNDKTQSVLPKFMKDRMDAG